MSEALAGRFFRRIALVIVERFHSSLAGGNLNIASRLGEQHGDLRLTQGFRLVQPLLHQVLVKLLHQFRSSTVGHRPKRRQNRRCTAQLHGRAKAFDFRPVAAATTSGLTGRKGDKIDAAETERFFAPKSERAR